MSGLITAFLSSFIATLLIIRFKHLHAHFSADSDFSGPQKFHTSAVPRVGGLSIALGLLTATFIKILNLGPENPGLILLLCAAPTFTIGLAEDLTKKISVRIRLLFTAISAGLAIISLNAQIIRLDIPFVDLLFVIPFFGFALTIIAITGLANSYNIIDGFNGLSSMVGILSLLALSYVSYLLGDNTIIHLSLVMAAAILGFFIWNYPQGLIFLGDGGAYLIGFWIGTLSIWLCFRHPEVSPWFALLINGYPIMETMFSIYRRTIHQGKSPGQPDGIHFHTLIYRRILHAKYYENTLSANARTAPYLWIMAGMSIIPATLFWYSTLLLIMSSTLFIIFYLWTYTRIIRFKTPSWMQ